MAFIHLDEAKRAAIEHVKRCVHKVSGIERALLGADLFGKLRVILWASREGFDQVQARLRADLESACGPWWTGEVLSASEATESDRTLWQHAWDDARGQPDIGRLRILDRHRSRTAWFVEISDPLWNAPHDGPPVVVFYSFKGGLGRSTALASFAIQRARHAERVAVVDFDLDAPGVGRLLAADDKGTTSPWGTVDYLLERGQGEVPLSDYYHPCRRVSGQGDIVVVPAGRLDGEYADKLARVDLEQSPTQGRSPVAWLLESIRSELRSNWILLDARAGLSEPAGHLLSGLAHLHVLFGTTSEQSWQGLTVVIDRLGRQRLFGGRPQAECLLIHALVPADIEAARRATEAFSERARREFTELYYAEEPEDASDERFWDIRDLDTEDAPHVPVSMAYESRLAHFGDIAEVAELLAESKDYRNLEARISERFEREPEL
jgi:cellulose biosynthesis protein BcsQ